MKKVFPCLPLFAAMLLSSCAYLQPQKKTAVAPEFPPAKTYDIIQILAITSYPKEDVPNIQKAMQYQDWLDISKDAETGVYQVQKASVTPIYARKTKKAAPHAASLQVQSPAVFLLRGLDVAFGPVDAVEIEKQIIWPGQQAMFSFNGKKYYLSAEGNVAAGIAGQALRKNPDDVYFWETVSDYRLYLSQTKKGPKQLLLSVDSFKETIARILWIGDLDRDGNPDLLLSDGSCRNHPQISLYLSTLADEENIFIKKAATFSYTAVAQAKD